jgi:hypothetical protein
VHAAPSNMDEKLIKTLACPEFGLWRENLWGEISMQAISEGWVRESEMTADGVINHHLDRWASLWETLVSSPAETVFSLDLVPLFRGGPLSVQANGTMSGRNPLPFPPARVPVRACEIPAFSQDRTFSVRSILEFPHHSSPIDRRQTTV